MVAAVNVFSRYTRPMKEKPIKHEHIAGEHDDGRHRRPVKTPVERWHDEESSER
jgi:hypothetical protein